MNFSLPRFFRKDKAAASAETESAPIKTAPPPIAKPASERLGKTVMPNMSRVMEPDMPAVAATAPAASPNARPVAAPPAASSPSPAPTAPRTISLGEARAPLVAPKLAPAPPEGAHSGERTVALQLTELLPQIPDELLEKTEIDPAHRIVFNAAELERGMASGRPAVLLRSIYQQAPTIFTGEIGAQDEREITLPFQAVLEQFATLQVRSDQVVEEIGPEVETPFSKVTIEDGERFGTPLQPLPKPSAPVSIPAPAPATMAAPAPTVPVKLPSLAPLPTLAPIASPAPAAKLSPPAPIRLPMPPQPSAPAATPSLAASNESAPQPSAPPLAVEKLSPNGTGAPATERVPASSGSPVPTPLPAPFAPSPLGRTEFKISPPASDLCPPPPLPLKPAAAESEPLAFSAQGARIRLPLRAILRELPPFQFTGSLEQVAENAEIEMPFAIIEPQLSLGRVAISPAQFHAAMPEEYRAFFHLDEGGLPVALPLPEVLRNLPNESLRLRRDQVEAVVPQLFETPFSQKAAEDAERLQVPAAPVAKEEAIAAKAKALAPPVSELAAIPEMPPASLEPVAILQAATAPIEPALASEPAERSPLQIAFETDEPLDAKSIVAHASRLPGVGACAIVFSDGLSLAGNIPAEYEADALCAMAPEIVKRIDEQMIGANFGALQGVTLFCAKAPVSFFAHGNICLAAIHSAGEIAGEIRGRLVQITEELARIYAQPA